MAAAVAMRFFAIFSEAASIILPSSEAAPLPCASASLSATMMRSARSTSLAGRREHLVGELDLRGMDRPLALDAERGGALGARRVAFRIGEVAERTVDRTQAVGAAGDRHARQREVPLVARIVGVEAADDDGARLVEGGVVGDAEVHGLEAAVGRRRSLRRWPCRAAVSISASMPTLLVKPLATSIWLTMLSTRVDVGRHADLGNEDGVEPGAGLLHRCRRRRGTCSACRGR